MKGSVYFAALALTSIGSSASADTKQINETVHISPTRTGEEIQLANGRKMTVDGSHGVIVNDDSGEVSIERCYGVSFPESAPKSIGGANICAAVYDNGDVLLMWLTWTDESEPTTWMVMGGTGRFEGATGSGTTTTVSTHGDGSWTGKGRATITTK